MKVYKLKDKISIDEFQNKSIRWLIYNQCQLIHSAKNSNEFDLDFEGRELLKKVRRARKKGEDFW